MDKELYQVLQFFDDDITNYLLLKKLLQYSPTEIRVRINQEIILIVNGRLIHTEYMVKSHQIEEIFNRVCDYSINAFEEEISQGFITLNGNHRVGIAGDFIVNGNTRILKKIKSLNFRISYDKDFEINIGKFDRGILMIAPPHTGKTTALRSIIKKLSDTSIVCVCDERNELACNSNCDYIAGIPKNLSIEMATRTLNPEYIICDEIGNVQEANAILSCLNTGVKFICSAHGTSYDDIKNRKNINILIKNNIFDKIIVLDKKDNNYFVKEIVNV